MKYLKKVVPYIMDLVTFIFVGGIVLFTTCNRELMEQYPMVRILIAVTVTLYLINYLFSFIVLAILAVVDAVFKNYICTKAIYIEQLIDKSSAFVTTKNAFKRKADQANENLDDCRYRICIISNGRIKKLTSTNYHELVPYRKYQFVYGKCSKVLFDVTEIKQ